MDCLDKEKWYNFPQILFIHTIKAKDAAQTVDADAKAKFETSINNKNKETPPMNLQ